MEALSLADGAYLTNGERLYQVIREWAPSGQVLLEDAGDPTLPAVSLNVTQLVADQWRVVRPA